MQMRLSFLTALGLVAACSSDPGTSPDAAVTLADATATFPDAAATFPDAAPANPDAAMGDPDAGGANTCASTAVPCVDESILALDFKQGVNPRMVTTTATTGGFISAIDATAGAQPPNIPASQGYVYARFTEQGLERVSVGDWDSVESTDWDIAFRRFVVRINSGVSGPSCVGALRTPALSTFDSVTAIPAGAPALETYMDPNDTCALVADPGRLNSPIVALDSYWGYRSCVEMTGNIFVLVLADGRAVKLQVLSYYNPAVQAVCDRNGALPMNTPSGAANMRVKWAFLP